MTVWILYGCYLSSLLCAPCCPVLGPPAMNTQHRVYNWCRNPHKFLIREHRRKTQRRSKDMILSTARLLTALLFYKVLVFTPWWAESESIVWIVVDSCCFQISRPPWSRRSSMINHLFCKFVFLTIRKRASCSITEGRFSTSLTSSVVWLSLPAYQHTSDIS